MRVVALRGSSTPSCRSEPRPHGIWIAMPASVPQPTGALDTACRQRRPASPHRCVGCASGCAAGAMEAPLPEGACQTTSTRSIGHFSTVGWNGVVATTMWGALIEVASEELGIVDVWQAADGTMLKGPRSPSTRRLRLPNLATDRGKAGSPSKSPLWMERAAL